MSSLFQSHFVLYVNLFANEGRTIVQVVSHQALSALDGFDSRSGHVGFVLNNVALVRVFSKYLSFLYQFSLRQLLHIRKLISCGI
jgi:hypothetical protein